MDLSAEKTFQKLSASLKVSLLFVTSVVSCLRLECKLPHNVNLISIQIWIEKPNGGQNLNFQKMIRAQKLPNSKIEIGSFQF